MRKVPKLEDSVGRSCMEMVNFECSTFLGVMVEDKNAKWPIAPNEHRREGNVLPMEAEDDVKFRGAIKLCSTEDCAADM